MIQMPIVASVFYIHAALWFYKMERHTLSLDNILTEKATITIKPKCFLFFCVRQVTQKIFWNVFF